MIGRYLSLGVLAFCCAIGAASESATVEIQGITATDAGKKPVSIPASLTRFKDILNSTPYGTFADIGLKQVKLAGGEKSSAAVGKYTVEFTEAKIIHGTKLRATVTLKEDGKPLGTPLRYWLAKDRPQIIEAGSKDAKTIFVVMLKSIDQ